MQLQGFLERNTFLSLMFFLEVHLEYPLSMLNQIRVCQKPLHHPGILPIETLIKNDISISKHARIEQPRLVLPKIVVPIP